MNKDKDPTLLQIFFFGGGILKWRYLSFFLGLIVGFYEIDLQEMGLRQRTEFIWSEEVYL